MVLQLLKQDIFKRGTQVLRADIFKFLEGNIELITAAGAPVGQWAEGTMFANLTDGKLYLSSNFRDLNLPSIAWHKFDGNVTDYSENGRHGTFTNENYDGGYYSKAADLNGVDNSIELPADEIGAALSYNFWLKLPADFTEDDLVYIVSRKQSSQNYYVVSIVGNASNQGIVNWKFNGKNSGEQTHSFTTIPITRNTWVYLCVKMQDGSIAVDRDGVNEHYSGGSNLNDVFTTESRWTGYSIWDTSFGNKDFLMDDLKIWSGIKNPTVIDKSNLDKNQWYSYPGTYVKYI